MVGEVAEEDRGGFVAEKVGEGTENGELDVGAPKTRFVEHSAYDGVVEDRQDQMLELDFHGGDRSGLLRDLVVEMEILGLASLVGLRALNGGHE